MDELEMIEKDAAPSSQAVLYRPAPTVEERRTAGLAAREACPIDLAAVGPESLENIAQLCAWSLTHAHARTGDEVAISAYLDEGHTFGDAMWDFACAYADQNEADYQAFIERVDS